MPKKKSEMLVMPKAWLEDLEHTALNPSASGSILKESVDVANFAMFTADVSKSLPIESATTLLQFITPLT